MKRLNVIELRTSLSDILNRAEYTGERAVIHRRGKDAAAIIPIEDLRLLERLVAEAEDREDIAAARAALAEPGGRISYDDFRRRKGLADVKEDTPTAGGRARRATKAKVRD
jgi:prevent-host-death family protein